VQIVPVFKRAKLTEILDYKHTEKHSFMV